jgi:hypothetical protein
VSEELMSQHELLVLLGNCIMALSLSNEERILDMEKAAGEKHIEELDRRFPQWREEAKQY